MNKSYLFALVLAIPFLFTQCKKDAVETFDCTGVAPTYTNEVKAILDARCATAGCHSAASKSEGVDLSSFAGAKSASAKSSFLGSIQHKSGYKSMPQGSAKLDDATIKVLSCWVQNGTPQ
jgi:hypothetical protein